MINIRKLTILLITLSFSYLTQARTIRFESKIKKSYKSIMKKDLKRLRQMRYSGNTDRNSLRVMGLSEMTTSSMLEWLENRVQVVIAQAEFKDIDIRIVSNNYTFPYNTKAQRPILEMNEQMDRLQKVQATTVMSNIGSAIYATGKFTDILYGVKLKARKLKRFHKVTSPRVGMIMIGDGHFMKKFDINKNNTKAISNSINRLSTFFHEARHSDGHAKSLGFFHAKCPTGHEYENLNACDRNLNGPYTVGSIATKEFTKACGKKCSQVSVDVLKMRYLDSLNRVIRKTVIGHDSKRLKKLIRLRDTYITIIENNIYKGEELEKAKARLVTIMKFIEEINRSDMKSSEIKSIFWDAAPEGKRS